MEINEKTVMETWRKTLKYLLESGEDFTDLDNRTCREAMNLIVTLETGSKDISAPLETMQSFDWIYPSREELSAVMLGSEEYATYEFSYGPRLFKFLHSKDQINEFIVPLLKSEPTSRRAVVSLFNPQSDSNIHSKNIPSLILIQFDIRHGVLNLTSFIRSNDFFIGWPCNLYQLSLLQKYVAEKLGIECGKITTISHSAHIFSEHFDMIRKIVER